MANQSIYSAFERFWLHVVSRINNKAEVNYVDEQITTVQNKIGEVPEGKTVIDLIGESGASDDKEIFIAEYGVTTYAEIEEAYNAGKFIMVYNSTYQAYGILSMLTTSSARFHYHTSNELYEYYVTSDDSWYRIKIPVVNLNGGTMSGALVAQNNTDYTTKQVRNIILVAEGEEIPTGANGDVCLVYTP